MAVITYREALNQALREEMDRDERVFLMGEEVGEYDGAYKVSKGLLDHFGGNEWRVRDTPIAENGFAGIGVGAAMAGLRPVVEFMTWNFSLLAFDAVVNSAAKMYQMSGGQYNVPIVFRGPGGAALQLAAQHSQVPDAWYSHVPGLKVVAPATPKDAKGLLKSAIRDPDPVLVIEGELLYNMKGEVPDGELLIPIGEAEVKRPGSDLTIVAHSKMVHQALQAADTLKQKHDLEAEVVDLRTLRPLDIDTVIESVKKTNREAFDWLDAPVTRVSGLDVPMPYARNLEKQVFPESKHVVRAAEHVCYLDQD